MLRWESNRYQQMDLPEWQCHSERMRLSSTVNIRILGREINSLDRLALLVNM